VAGSVVEPLSGSALLVISFVAVGSPVCCVAFAAAKVAHSYLLVRKR